VIKTTYPRPGLFFPAGLLLCASFTIAHGETFIQTVGDLDWNAAMWGTPASAPTTGNDYVSATGVTNNRFRISATGTASTFGGSSVTVITGTRALMKNQNGAISSLSGDFTLNGGRLSHAPNNGPHAGVLDVTNFIVSGTGSIVDINGTSSLTIDGVLNGNGDLLLKPELTAGGTISFTGISGYTGALTVQAPVRLDFGADYTFTSSLTLQTTAILNVDQSLTFEFGKLVANGVQIPVGTYTGGDISALGANFENGGGTLTVVQKDSDNDGLPDFYEDQIIAFNLSDTVDGYEDIAGPNNLPISTDFDADGRSDSAEYADGITAEQTNPTNPDSDGDGLKDGPEVDGTNNQGISTGFGPTNPNNANNDFDNFNDGTEVRYGSDPNNASVEPGDAAPLVNGSFEEPVLAISTEAASVSGGTVTGWSVSENDFYVIGNFDFTDVNNPVGASDGIQFATAERRAPNPDVDPTAYSNGIDSNMGMKQDLDVSSFAAAIDGGARTFLLDFDCRDNDTADQGVVTLEFLDGSGSNLGRSSVFRTPDSGQVWTRYRHSGYPPVGTRTIRITATAAKIVAGATTVRNIAFDNFTGRLVHFDFDSDGMADGWELLYGLNPDSSADAGISADTDGLSNLQEFQLGTNPTLADTDTDGVDDDDEVASGSDPLDPASLPAADLRVTDVITTKDATGQVTQVQVVVTGLNVNKTYRLVRGTDLLSFPTVVDTHQPAGTTDSFIDSTPLPKETSPKAFYRLED
jgi:Bacterial TSP3 repeat